MNKQSALARFLEDEVELVFREDPWTDFRLRIQFSSQNNTALPHTPMSSLSDNGVLIKDLPAKGKNDKTIVGLKPF
jgi:hypothetical protein